MISLMNGMTSTIYYTEFDSQFSASFNHVQSLSNKPLHLFKINNPLPNHSIIVITGSIYFLGEMKQYLKKNHINDVHKMA